MYSSYRALTRCLSPFIPLLLNRRLKRGKEDPARIGERLGQAGLPRPSGTLVWIHAASVGEANAAIPLLEGLKQSYPDVHLLLTTVTVTSAALTRERAGIVGFMHQFAPVDTPQAVAAFLDHWQPDVALWVDSELWPSLIIETHKRGAILGMINARISERSFKRWNIIRLFSKKILSCFSICFAQSEEDASRLKRLGVLNIDYTGNLKYDAPVLPCDEEEYVRLAGQISNRPVWLAACTHPGEEERIASMHTALAKNIPNLLTIIVPRHAVRGNAIAQQLSALRIAQRSKEQAIDSQVEVYLADTMGELGLFYRLASVVLIGGSLVLHGGQNPLEAAKLGCAVMMGPHMENFTAITRELLAAQAALQVADADALTAALADLFADDVQRQQLGGRALRHVKGHEGIVERIMNRLQPYLA
jgi:3-deoxy-D-manno-octulosonic-acid transferase